MGWVGEQLPRGARLCGLECKSRADGNRLSMDPRVGLDAAFSGRNSRRLAGPALLLGKWSQGFNICLTSGGPGEAS